MASESDIFRHPFVKFYNRLYFEGKIPPKGDSEFFWIAMILRVGKLLHERLNFNNSHYLLEIKGKSEPFIIKLENELNSGLKRYGIKNLGTTILLGSYQDILNSLDTLYELVINRDLYELRWKPSF